MERGAVMAEGPADDSPRELPDATTRDFVPWYEAQYSPMVSTLALVSGNRSLAADAVSEAFARAYEQWEKVRRMSSPTGWTYTVALNLL
jgi:RNA polymerase sigma-70 factor, ECF subfamily